ncbi:MAG: methyl-accepting chemotaxis protein [Spirochaetales bacterium]|nr:methyl-accepting chemotaxis protein [Spirochaetales bacterium]
MFQTWRLKQKLLVPVISILLLSAATLALAHVITTLRDAEMRIQRYRQESIAAEKAKIQDSVTLAIEVLEAEYRRSSDPQWIEQRDGKQLIQIAETAMSSLSPLVQARQEGRLSPALARQQALNQLRSIRFDGENGMLWLITPENKPKLVMHPNLSDRVGTFLDDAKFSTVEKGPSSLGESGKENLFVAASRIAQDQKSGFIHHRWPKIMADGSITAKPRLTYVRALPEWGWVLGICTHVDDADSISRQSAQDILRNMRYAGGNGYFWINDTSSPYPKMVMHPVKSELEGTILNDPRYETTNLGQNLFTMANDITLLGGGGFLQYSWEKPMAELPGVLESKTAFVRPFEPWNWVVGTGFYPGDIEAIAAAREQETFLTLRNSLWAYLVVTLAFSALGALILYGMIRRILKPIDAVATWSENLAHGDLTKRLEYTGGDEIGQQGKHLNAAAQAVCELMDRIKGLTEEAETMKFQLKESTVETGTAVEQISQSLTSVRERFHGLQGSIDGSENAVEQIGGNITRLEDQITRQAAAVEESSAAMEEMLGSLNNITRTSTERKEAVQDLRGMLTDCRGRFGAMNTSIESLSRAEEAMTGMASVISTIAARTSLLSINAAIEAAHAGDAGDGFAVVAGEMRDLAENAGKNAASIQESLDGNVRDIERLLVESVEVKTVYSSLEEEVEQMADALGEMSMAMDEMSQGSREILESVEILRQVSSEVLDGSMDMTKDRKVVEQSLKDVVDLSKDMGVAITEVDQGTKSIEGTITGLEEQVQHIVESITGISREVGRFKTDGEST